MAGNSCREDEALLRQVRCAQREYMAGQRAKKRAAAGAAGGGGDGGGGGGGSGDNVSHPMLIADCRPKANAVVRTYYLRPSSCGLHRVAVVCVGGCACAMRRACVVRWGVCRACVWCANPLRAQRAVVGAEG